MNRKLAVSLTIAGLLIIGVISTLILTGRNNTVSGKAAPQSVETLENFGQLSQQFHSDSGNVRIIALLSPT